MEDNTRERGQAHRYGAALANQIELKWQKYWSKHGTFVAPNPGSEHFEPTKPKQYVLDMFPFPSGAGLHVGHPRGYIATDVYARFLRMCGYNVLHTMGFDAFGLPAEQFAIETGTHPRTSTERNIAAIRQQLERLGLAHDPRRRIATTDVEYVRWTQWIFLQIFNAWYDTSADRARPIAELIAEFISGKRSLEGHPTFSGRTWSSLTDAERRRVIDGHRLAYLDYVTVNWCPALGTVLANEEVTKDGRSERGNHPVARRPLRQWMLRITAYAERLGRELDQVDWPDSIKAMQRNWIGRSNGAEVIFRLVPVCEDSARATVRVFTTRPETIFGATYLVLAPEHPLVDDITAASQREAVTTYKRSVELKSDLERTELAKAKTGVFTGTYATNPVNQEHIPVWVADYVLGTVGTGAIMAVPAHDERDFEFATRHSLDIKNVVVPNEQNSWWLEHSFELHTPLDQALLVEHYIALCQVKPGAFSQQGEDTVVVNSASSHLSLDGLSAPLARERTISWLEKTGIGARTINYKLRDWLFSRQRYWGEPIPMVFDECDLPVPLPESALPVTLPELVDFLPESSEDASALPRPPLSRATDWVSVELDLGDGARVYRRETNTMPQWAGSCWYYLRYLDPENRRALCDPEIERYWMGDSVASPDKNTGVDLYVGGVEHAVLHLLYSRFWHKILFDLGVVSGPEPFKKLYNQGYVLAPAYTDHRGVYVPSKEVEQKDGASFYQGQAVEEHLGKMGKSIKNGVSPDDVFDEYGCDTLRLYEMVMGPLNASQPWNPRDIVGVHRFLQRLWRSIVDENTGALRVSDNSPSPEMSRLLAKTIAAVRHDIRELSFNTAIAKLIELNNVVVKSQMMPAVVARDLVLLIAPFAPHFAEELWQRLGNERSLAYHSYPVPDPRCLQESSVTLSVAISGRVRLTLTVPVETSQDEIQRLAMQDVRVQPFLNNGTVKKIVYVPGRMLNFVMEG